MRSKSLLPTVDKAKLISAHPPGGKQYTVDLGYEFSLLKHSLERSTKQEEEQVEDDE